MHEDRWSRTLFFCSNMRKVTMQKPRNSVRFPNLLTLLIIVEGQPSEFEKIKIDNLKTTFADFGLLSRQRLRTLQFYR